MRLIYHPDAAAELNRGNLVTSFLMKDSIVEQVRDAKASSAAEFNYDLPKYLAWIREQTKVRKKTVCESGLTQRQKTAQPRNFKAVTR